jgi:hypothetical protein
MENPMKAEEISRLAVQILEALKPIESDPYKCMAALRTAAHSIENLITASITKQAVISGLSHMVGRSNHKK